MFSARLMQEVANADYVQRIVANYGPAGSTALRSLLGSLREIYRYIPPERLNGGLTVFTPLDPGNAVLPPDSMEVKVERILRVVEMGPVTVADVGGGLLACWRQELDHGEISSEAVVYHFDGKDRFRVGNGYVDVPPTPGYSSLFAIPTFTDLNLALEHYGDVLAKRSRCKILAECWQDTERNLLVNKPESLMRDSLTQCLLSTFRDGIVEVRPEQKVDETRPVDIKVTWSETNQIALIEVKWLGDSQSANGVGRTRYRDARANSGAAQLAEYLDLNATHAPLHFTLGYLVVFDARRRGLSADGGSHVSEADAWHYVDQEIAYDSAVLGRPDLADPYRFYLEPAVPRPAPPS